MILTWRAIPVAASRWFAFFAAIPPYADQAGQAWSRICGHGSSAAANGTDMYRADLHIHSRFSMATSKRLTVSNLAAWAAIKGIDVLATGDITHPAWRSELCDALVFDEESGLYRLRSPLTRKTVEKETGIWLSTEPEAPLFILEGEISSIYKRHGKTRKMHNLVFLPDFAAADRLCSALSAIGNISSDGRPILGLDAHDLLETTLNLPGAEFIPAHIWTPWFSLFGSKSGFDSMEEAFGDLAGEIFAAETGLSSDPDMNRCLSALDGIALVSNSDAHSGENLAREVNLFSGSPSYAGLFAALRSRGVGFSGTVEFFPEEGKYHLDGHRACGVMLEPSESMKLGNLCPVCGKPLTVGVLHRVLELADRSVPLRPGDGFTSLIPLAEVIGEICGCGAKSRRAVSKYAETVDRFGSELAVLTQAPIREIAGYWAELGEAVQRMRDGRVIKQGGYDGEYGVIRLFDKNELGRGRAPRISLSGQEDKAPRGIDCHAPSSTVGLLPGLDGAKACGADQAISGNAKEMQRKPPSGERAVRPTFLSQKKFMDEYGKQPPVHMMTAQASPAVSRKGPLDGLSDEQKKACLADGPALVLAGPGAGKTRTLVGRVQRLIAEGCPAENIAAITFTRRAAEELRARLASAGISGITADTLHGLALARWPAPKPAVLNEDTAMGLFAKVVPGMRPRDMKKAWNAMVLARENLLARQDETYREQKQASGAADFTDLLEGWLERLENGETAPWTEILLDEAQDLSRLERALVKKLTEGKEKGFFAIGDPDQAIYGFRTPEGYTAHGIEEFAPEAWPGITILEMTDCHRCEAGILEKAGEVLGSARKSPVLRPVSAGKAYVEWREASDAFDEAEYLAETILGLLGGSSHSAADGAAFRDAGGGPAFGSCSPGDIAVLVRTRAIAEPILKALARKGVPAGMPESEAFFRDRQVTELLKRHEASPGDPPEDLLKGIGGTSNKAFLEFQRRWVLAGSWEAFMEELALLRDGDLVRSHAEIVQVLTMHAAKGLEFRVVFIPGLEEGIMPFYGSGYLAGEDMRPLSGGCLDEERRILYVAMTRASEALYLSNAAERRIYGHVARLPAGSLLTKGGCIVKRMRKKKRGSSRLSLLP